MFRRLAEKADVVIENYRPGVMDRFGLGYEALKQINPRLIYGAITGFGSTGPFSQRPGYDIISQAMGGMMSVTGQEGDPPTRSGNALGDILGGMNLAIGVLVALQARNVTGEGQYVDVALVDSVAASLEQAWQRYFVSGELPTLVVHNSDKPGCVSQVTGALAAQGLNVATLQLNRGGRGGSAVMVIECDQPISDMPAQWLRALPGILRVPCYTPDREEELV